MTTPLTTDLLWGLLAGVVVGTGVAAFGAMRAKARYENQAATLASTLQTQGQQVQATLTAGGATFRTELEAVSRAAATSIALGRAAQLLNAYGLNASTLARLERLS